MLKRIKHYIHPGFILTGWPMYMEFENFGKKALNLIFFEKT